MRRTGQRFTRIAARLDEMATKQELRERRAETWRYFEVVASRAGAAGPRRGPAGVTSMRLRAPGDLRVGEHRKEIELFGQRPRYAEE